jgi:hypothetical protein
MMQSFNYDCIPSFAYLGIFSASRFTGKADAGKADAGQHTYSPPRIHRPKPTHKT